MTSAIRATLDAYAEAIGQPPPIHRDAEHRAYLVWHLIRNLLPCCEELGINLEAAVRSAKHLSGTGPMIETQMELEDQSWLNSN